MTNLETLEKVRAKVIEAVPEIVVLDEATRFAGSQKYYPRPITLADVLRAIPSEASLSVTNEGQFSTFLDVGNGEMSETWQGTLTVWNLALSLDDQEPAVIEFIGKVLGV